MAKTGWKYVNAHAVDTARASTTHAHTGDMKTWRLRLHAHQTTEHSVLPPSLHPRTRLSQNRWLPAIYACVRIPLLLPCRRQVWNKFTDFSAYCCHRSIVGNCR